MMSGASGLGSGEGAIGRGFRWTDLFRSGSSEPIYFYLNFPNDELEYQPDNKYTDEQAVLHDLPHVPEIEEDKHGPEDGTTENFHPDVEQNLVNEIAHLRLNGCEERWPGWPRESVFRMLVPAKKVVGVIGQKGDYIKKACEETKAQIKILEGPPGTRERVVMVSAKEEPNIPLPPAVDGLLRVHKHFEGSKVSTSLLVPDAQARSLVGAIQQEFNCIIRVLGTEDLPVFALQDDRIVEVVGEPADVHKAIGLIASHLRNYLVDSSMIEMQMQMPNPRMERMPPAAQPWIPPLQSNPPASLGSTPPPPPPPDKYYSYGREAPMHPSSSQPAPSIITEITQPMPTLLLYPEAVIRKLVSSISYIQQVTGATVTTQDARGMPGKMNVEISGTTSQVQTALKFIQYFMAQAAGQQQQTQHAPEAADYNSDAAHGTAAHTSNPPPSEQTGGFGSYYGYWGRSF